MSSWTSEKFWMSSTAVAAGMAVSTVPPAASQARAHTTARIFLPPYIGLRESGNSFHEQSVHPR
jgi:hypothetical protein